MKFSKYLIISLSVIILSCDDNEGGNNPIDNDVDYFPLALGNYWKYGEDDDSNDDFSDDEVFINTVIDTDYNFNEKVYSLIETTDVSGNKLDSLLVRKENNNYIIATEDFLDLSTDISDQEKELILLKSGSSVGTKWQYNFTLNNIEFDGEIIDGITIDVKVIFEIIDDNKSINTQAGNFNNVIVVQQTIDLPVLFDEIEALLPITSFYFVPDVGIVFIEIEYQEDDDSNSTEIEETELIEYSIN
ncbi:hypothetical protein [Marinigracilibium pacificum]|uniref:Uncharacterized protein n=1 Tax=Marinigracilibium pacificum TaxID=2729599 RepID=A0A848IV03_9BACT|nr:hypothetical protein [Marinigracilibium pacificum]NMM47061.1 hypothetical protein [Marinigracilibium pacificum]